ncbi:MAG: DNA polymerase III subunit delta [Clostridia bacterium]|nr:DNA polymerase III subunit delta [Clostridia bacterium]
MDIQSFKSSLKSGQVGGLYLFCGEEDYLVRYYLKSLRERVAPDEAFAVFNNPVFDGEDIDFAQIIEAVKAPPMMSDYKLIEWRHADFTGLREGQLEALEELISVLAEHPYSIVAFTADDGCVDFGSAKKPSAFIKRFEKQINILRFEKSTENQLYAWLKKHFDHHGVEVNLDTVKTLVFRSGRSMDVLAGEVEKLCALALSRGRSTVTPDDVNEVASSTPECDTFALSNAIIERNKAKAYFALEDMKLRRVDPTVIMGMVARTFDDLAAVSHMLDDGLDSAKIESALNMNKYKLKIYIPAAKNYGTARLGKIISDLAVADAGSKYGGVTGYTAIELFISKNL